LAGGSAAETAVAESAKATANASLETCNGYDCVFMIIMAPFFSSHRLCYIR